MTGKAPGAGGTAGADSIREATGLGPGALAGGAGGISLWIGMPGKPANTETGPLADNGDSGDGPDSWASREASNMVEVGATRAAPGAGGTVID